MEQRVHSGSATRPVLIAIVSTIAVCGLCQTAYNKFVVAPERDFQEIDNSEQSACVCQDAALSDRSTSKEHYSQKRKLNARRTATLLRTLTNARDRKRDSEEEAERSEDDALAEALSDESEGYNPSKEAILARKQAEMKTMDEQLVDESVDHDWAIETEDAAANAFAALEANLRLEELTCGKTLCRARMTHHDPSTRRDDIDRLVDTPELGYQMTSYIPPDDEDSTVMYFARKGHTLSVLGSNTANLPLPPGFGGQGEFSRGELPQPPDVRHQEL